MATIASFADCCDEYSIKPYPLCLPVIWSGASEQAITFPNASNTLRKKVRHKNLYSSNYVAKNKTQKKNDNQK